MWKVCVGAVFVQQVSALITTQDQIINQWSYNGHGKNWGFSCSSGPQSPIELPAFVRDSESVATVNSASGTIAGTDGTQTVEEMLLYRYPNTLWPNFNDDGRSIWGNFPSDVQTGGFGVLKKNFPKKIFG